MSVNITVHKLDKEPAGKTGGGAGFVLNRWPGRPGMDMIRRAYAWEPRDMECQMKGVLPGDTEWWQKGLVT